MYYTGLDPRSMKPVYVERDPHKKAMQRALIQYRDPKNYELVTEALIAAGRRDLVGFSANCLIRPRQGDKRFAPKAAQPQSRAALPQKGGKRRQSNEWKGKRR